MRVRSTVYTRQRKKKIFRLAKGYYSKKRTSWKMTVQAVEKSLNAMYGGRKKRKGDFRGLWIARINAACRQMDVPYGRFVEGLKKAGVPLNRKMLAEIAVRDPASFQKLVGISRGT